MKKLILIPTILITSFLAIAFLMPSTASGVVRSVAPGLTSVLASAVSETTQSAVTSRSAATRGAVSAVKQGSQAGAQSSTADFASEQAASGHSAATPIHPNCGRFGNGFHGGKHLLVCPNRPFPAPANP